MAISTHFVRLLWLLVVIISCVATRSEDACGGSTALVTAPGASSSALTSTTTIHSTIESTITLTATQTATVTPVELATAAAFPDTVSTRSTKTVTRVWHISKVSHHQTPTLTPTPLPALAGKGFTSLPKVHFKNYASVLKPSSATSSSTPSSFANESIVTEVPDTSPGSGQLHVVEVSIHKVKFTPLTPAHAPTTARPPVISSISLSPSSSEQVSVDALSDWHAPETTVGPVASPSLANPTYPAHAAAARRDNGPVISWSHWTFTSWTTFALDPPLPTESAHAGPVPAPVPLPVSSHVIVSVKTSVIHAEPASTHGPAMESASAANVEPPSSIPSFTFAPSPAPSPPRGFTTLSRPSTSPTTANVAPTNHAASCPEVPVDTMGPFTINWDDEPAFGISNDTGNVPFPPVFNPYHRLFFSNGFAYAPPPSDPFLPQSPPRLALFLPNNNATGEDGPRLGELGAGPRASSPAFWFNAYGVYLGCDNAGPETCKIDIRGFRWVEEFHDEMLVMTYKLTLPPCPSLQNCPLIHFGMDGLFNGVSSLQFDAHVGDQARIFYMDDLSLGWTNNTCAAASERAAVRENGV